MRVLIVEYGPLVAILSEDQIECCGSGVISTAAPHAGAMASLLDTSRTSHPVQQG
jgi:hypothetical protein